MHGYIVPGLCLRSFGGTPCISHKIMTEIPYFHVLTPRKLPLVSASCYVKIMTNSTFRFY